MIAQGGDLITGTLLALHTHSPLCTTAHTLLLIPYRAMGFVWLLGWISICLLSVINYLFYSLRTLCRSLSYAAKNIFKNIRRSLYEVILIIILLKLIIIFIILFIIIILGFVIEFLFSVKS